MTTHIPTDYPPSRSIQSAPEQFIGTNHKNGSAPNHLFANNVRFLSMVAIIGLHAIGDAGLLLNLFSIHEAYLFLTQILKFGTIGFFLISGFLFGERIDQYSPLQYLKRRLRRVFLPWLVWFLLLCCVLLGRDYIKGRVGEFNLTYGLSLCTEGLFGTAFWFVPNLLIAMTILLVMHRYLRDIRIGFAFLLASLFYGVNIYGHWISVEHSRAVFGFVFYLWLGAWGAWNFSAIEKFLARIPQSAMLGLVLLTYSLAIAEAKLLVALGSSDPTNTLRISNQIFSVVVVLAIVKVKRAIWPKFVNVREQTFGLYLTHVVVLFVLHYLLGHILLHSASVLRWAGGKGVIVGIPLLFFVMTYAGCLLLVQTLLSNPHLRWTVGLSTRKTITTGRPEGS